MRRPTARVVLAVAATLAVALTFQLLTSPPDVLVSALDLDRPHGGGGSVLSAWRQTKPARPDAEDAEPDGALLVTAYFPFDSAKHGQEEYDAWMRLFLATMRADVYMFCPAHVAAKVKDMRGALPLVLDTTWTSPRDIPPLASPARRAQLAAQRDLDREKAYHNADLYAVWAAKPFFVDTALKAGRTYRYAFWMDIGTFRRPHAFARWPEMVAVDSFWNDASRAGGTPADDLVLIPTQWAPPASTKTWNETQGPIDIDFAIGSMFGGSPRALAWFNALYWTYFYHYLDAGLFVGKDQTMWTALMYLYPKRFITVWANDPQTMPGKNRGEGAGDCGGWWGYYVYWLAPARERHATEEEFFAVRRCRRIRVLSVYDLLRRTLGWWWSPPRPSLKVVQPPAYVYGDGL